MILTLAIGLSLNKTLNHRWDGCPTLPYYSAEDLGLEEEGFSFLDEKYLIDGSRYYVKGLTPKALIVVFHGIGAGRNAYLKEISVLAHEGYLIYSYDNLGCMRSEGRGPKSLGRVYETQAKFFAWLDKDPKAQGLPRYSFGHSWGGYSSMLSTNPKYNIEKCVCLSGLLKPSDACYHSLQKKHLDFLKLPIRLAIRLFSGKNCNVDAQKIFNQSKAKMLYIVGENDSLVSKEFNGNKLFEGFANSGRFEYKVIPGSGHGVMYSHEAEKYQADLIAQGLTRINSPVGLEMDIDKATAHNPEVMSSIIHFFEN